LDYGLLDSALETPFQTFDGKELYPTIQEKGARLGFGLIKKEYEDLLQWVIGHQI
jgi:death-on-curing protein